MSSKRNFTLLETVIAVALLGVIASIITSILFTVQQSWIRVKKHTSELESRMKMDQVADLVFRNSIPFYWKDLNGKEKSVFHGQPDELILAYRHRINSAEDTGIRFVRIFLADNNLVASYRSQPILYWKEETMPGSLKEEVIVTGVESLYFSYADRINERIEWKNSWDKENKNIPLAINLKIKFEDGSIIQYLRRTAGSSFYSVWGKRDESTL